MSSRPRDHHRVVHGDIEQTNERPHFAKVPVDQIAADRRRLIDVHDPANHLIGTLTRGEAGDLHLWAQTHGTTPRALLDLETAEGPQFVEFYALRGDVLELLCEQCRGGWQVTATQLLEGAKGSTRRGKVPRLNLP